MRYEVTNITWDLWYEEDENEMNLPYEIVVEIPTQGQEGDRLSSGTDIQTYIKGYVLDKTGKEMYDFEYTPLTNLT